MVVLRQPLKKDQTRGRYLRTAFSPGDENTTSMSAVVTAAYIFSVLSDHSTRGRSLAKMSRKQETCRANFLREHSEWQSAMVTALICCGQKTEAELSTVSRL